MMSAPRSGNRYHLDVGGDGLETRRLMKEGGGGEERGGEEAVENRQRSRNAAASQRSPEQRRGRGGRRRAARRNSSAPPLANCGAEEGTTSCSHAAYAIRLISHISARNIYLPSHWCTCNSVRRNLPRPLERHFVPCVFVAATHVATLDGHALRDQMFFHFLVLVVRVFLASAQRRYVKHIV